MRLIPLIYSDFDLFDTPFNEVSFTFYCTHREAFRQMLKDQGRDFWIRFLLSFRSFHSHYGFIALMSAKTNKRFNETMDWFFIKLHEMFIDGTLSDAKQLFDDIVLIVEKRHLVQNLKSKSCAKDPFYLIETRDTYRRLFGNPTERVSYVRVVMVFPVYELFAGTLISCLKRWIDAVETDPSDTSYWIAAPSATAPDLTETEPNKPAAPTDTPTGPSPKIFSRQTVTQESVRADIESLLMRERLQGSEYGPMFVSGWPTNRDPRFIDPFNPLYDPAAKRGTDWRQNMNIDTFQCFVEFAGKHVSTATKQTTAAAGRVRITGVTYSQGEVKSGKQSNIATGNGGIDTGKQSNNATGNGSPMNLEVASSSMQRHREIRNKTTRENTTEHEQGVQCTYTEQIGDGHQVINKSQSMAVKCGSDGDVSDTVTTTTDTCVLYKVCAGCYQQETVTHQFKKCKKCKEVNCKDIKYYCSRQCQVSDWTARHCQEHRNASITTT